MAPVGGRDVIVAELESKTKLEANAEYRRRVNAGELEPGLTVISREAAAIVNDSIDNARRIRAREENRAMPRGRRTRGAP